jgi:hypothetical protein
MQQVQHAMRQWRQHDAGGRYDQQRNGQMPGQPPQESRGRERLLCAVFIHDGSPCGGGSVFFNFVAKPAPA